ncbi:MAG: hypothetical protein N2Z23_09415 [Pyrinomonadaceae bacterium]|nr:hypothetical protein [Pyrinomonadaceae bacterium]MCX7640641.1 hypothetical protein [Pyrinomonadaceae bacterium]MDW8305342.1 hypothetical protein [Acidobacteriota bacterium]
MNEITPLRRWIKVLLSELFEKNGTFIRSDLHAKAFTEWTGATHSWLVKRWEEERQSRTGAVTTTCNSFLNIVVWKIRQAGGIAHRTFPSFNLPKAGGSAWKWASGGRLPKVGDFYQIGTRGGMYKHVGIVYEIQQQDEYSFSAYLFGRMVYWKVAEAGQGGPMLGYDAIKLSELRPMDTGVMGWIDVDEFFVDWKGPVISNQSSTI